MVRKSSEDALKVMGFQQLLLMLLPQAYKFAGFMLFSPVSTKLK